ncbi:MAG: DNA-binding protein [Anaerolineae bacterium]|nr:DNA-binding protein [Anaerolineae bacterium]
MKQNNTPESDLPPKLAAPAYRALAAAGIQHLEQLTAWHEKDVKALHGIGPTAIEKLRKALQARGLSFKTEAG